MSERAAAVGGMREGWIRWEGEKTWNRSCYKYNPATFSYSSGANLFANSSSPSCVALDFV